MITETNQKVSWQQEIEKYTEALVNAAEDTLSEERMNLLKMDGRAWERNGYDRRDSKKPMKVAQFSNFLGLTKTAGNSPSAIRNWILYQMGRDDTQANWKKTGLGEAIIVHMAKMAEWAADIARNVYGEPTPEQVRRAYVTLVTMYAGYLQRWFIAKGGRES